MQAFHETKLLRKMRVSTSQGSDANSNRGLVGVWQAGGGQCGLF